MQALTLTRSTGATLGPATMIAAVALLALAGDGNVAIGAACLTATVAAVVDVREARIPDSLVVATIVPAVAHATALGLTGRPGVWAGVLVGAVVLGVPLLLVHLLAPAAMGFGDVKLAVALGFVCGVVSGSLALVALAVASGVTAAVGLMRRRSELPFAPGLVIGSTTAIATGLAAGLEIPRWR